MSKVLDIIKQVLNKASSNGKLYAFLLCLFLATFFWMLNALGNQFTTEIGFKIDYKNLSSDRVLLNKLPEQMDIQVRGLGFDLLAYTFRMRRPTLNIDLEKVKRNTSDTKGLGRSTISSTSFTPYISNQLGETIEIIEVYPDSILFLFDQKKEKIVKVLPDVEISFEKQFQLFGNILVKPAVVKAIGPKSVIDTLEAVYTKGIIYTDLSETVTEPIGLKDIYQNNKITFTPERVFLHIPVEKYTESSLSLSVAYVNFPDSIQIKLIPDRAELKFMVPLSKMANLPNAKFGVEVDYNEVVSTSKKRLTIRLTEHPDYIKSYTLNPKKVEYILKKRN